MGFKRKRQPMCDQSVEIKAIDLNLTYDFHKLFVFNTNDLHNVKFHSVWFMGFCYKCAQSSDYVFGHPINSCIFKYFGNDSFS